MFPGDLLPSTYPNPDNPSELRGRTELERRGKYIEVLGGVGQQLPALVLLIKACLLNVPGKRPTTEELLTALQKMRSEMEGTQGGGPMNLDIMVRVRMAKEMKMKDRQIEELTEQKVLDSFLLDKICHCQNYLYNYVGCGFGREDERVRRHKKGIRRTNTKTQ